jgi:hypothetical protein
MFNGFSFDFLPTLWFVFCWLKVLQNSAVTCCHSTLIFCCEKNLKSHLHVLQFWIVRILWFVLNMSELVNVFLDFPSYLSKRGLCQESQLDDLDNDSLVNLVPKLLWLHPKGKHGQEWGGWQQWQVKLKVQSFRMCHLVIHSYFVAWK